MRKYNIDLRNAKTDFVKSLNIMKDMYSEAIPMEVYRDIFPVGSFERKKEYDESKPNGILRYIKVPKGDGTYTAHTEIITDDLNAIMEAQKKKDVVTSGIGYFGKSNTKNNASLMYALILDIDYVDSEHLSNMIFMMQNDILPTPTYFVLSGHGVHLYYVMESPIRLYHSVHEKIVDFKANLIDLVWNQHTSTNIERKETLGLVQNFRVIGSQTKLGKGFNLTAFKTGEKASIEYLNEFLATEKRLNDFNYVSELTVDEAKVKYPDWYQRRIVFKQPRGSWVNKRALYDWWLRKIRSEVIVGKRYYCINCLAAFAIKCQIPYEELKEDAFALLPFFNKIEHSDTAPFTEEDMETGISLYFKDYVTMSRKSMEYKTGIDMTPKIKRRGRPQKLHLSIARNTKSILKSSGENIKEGRPSAKDDIELFCKAFPNKSVKDCMKELGYSINTVYKYWQSDPETKVKRWRRTHKDDNVKAHCIKDTGLSKPTVYKYWGD